MNMESNQISKIPLRDIFVGYIDAADEAAKENFLELFYDDSLYSEILKNEKYIIAGRKGTGKSLLAYYVKNKSEANNELNCELLSLEKFKLHKLKNLGNKSVSNDELSILWKWIIYIELAKKIIAINKHQCYLPFSPVRKLKQFISSINGESNSAYKLKSVKNLNGNSNKVNAKIRADVFEAASEAVNMSSVEKNYEPNMYYMMLEELTKLTMKALKSSDTIYLMFDDLDELEGKVEENSYYRELILSLVKTTKEINIEFRKNKFKHKTILLLRSDIIKVLMDYSTNLNKTIGDCKVTLNWIKRDVSVPHEHPLMMMILNKIKTTTKEYENIPNDMLYKHLFPRI